MKYFLVLVAVNLMWAFQFSGAKIATETLGPVTVVLLTMALSTAVMAPLVFVWPSEGRASRPSIGKAIAQMTLLGVGGAMISQLGLTAGVQMSLASNAAVLQLAIPALTAVFAAILLNEHMSRVRWLSFALALAGIALVSEADIRNADLSRQYLSGNLLLFAGCTGSAFYNTYSKRLLQHFSEIEVLVYSFAAATIALLPCAIVLEHPRWSAVLALPWPAWSSLLAIAIFSLSLSMILFLWVIDRIDVTQASLSIYLLPVFGVAMSTFALGERMTWRLAAGGALVVLSTFLVTIYEERKKVRGGTAVETA